MQLLVIVYGRPRRSRESHQAAHLHTKLYTNYDHQNAIYDKPNGVPESQQRPVADCKNGAILGYGQTAARAAPAGKCTVSLLNEWTLNGHQYLYLKEKAHTQPSLSVAEPLRRVRVEILLHTHTLSIMKMSRISQHLFHILTVPSAPEVARAGVVASTTPSTADVGMEKKTREVTRLLACGRSA